MVVLIVQTGMMRLVQSFTTQTIPLNAVLKDQIDTTAIHITMGAHSTAMMGIVYGTLMYIVKLTVQMPNAARITIISATV